MAKTKGLGRGLDAIFDDNRFGEETADGVKTIRISSIDPKPDQPRKNFEPEALAQLADSIAANGVLQPILVRQTGERYEIIAGERRFRGARLAGLTEIPALVLEADDLAAARYALIENLQREDLNPYEEAVAYDRLMEEFGLSQEEIAGQLGKSRSAVANALRLLDLPEEVVKMLVDGVLTAGHGRTLLGLKDRNQIVPLAKRCVSRNLSVREMEQVVKQANRIYAAEQLALEKAVDTAGETPVQVDYFASLESRFTSATGRQCKITETRNKKIFQVEYRDNEDLEELLKHLAGSDFFDNY
ncbi:MAG: ParB/RepB/Spo0J family partition protein [Ruminococcaceae bacterium]|nr:ParB/RepB/Spo0J family partition protein [Oscillospiraceae bacterium]